MPSKLTLTVMNSVHRALIAVTFGRVGWSMGGMPVLELTTTGRKSGQPRSTMLTAPLRIGDGLVVVASRGGDPTHPAWYHNLVADPHVQVALDGKPAVPMLARVLGPQERAQAWPQIASRYRNYAQYQTRTTREIPLVLLEADPSASA
mgnify:FL=1